MIGESLQLFTLSPPQRPPTNAIARTSFQTGDDLKSPASATGRAQFTYRQLNHNLQPDSRLPSSNPARINDVLEYLSNSVKEEQRRCEHFLTVQKSKM